MKNYINKKVKIFWNDAIIYNYKLIKKNNLSLSKRITEGELVKKIDDYLIIKNPQTSIYSDKDKIYIPKIDPKQKFFFIPKGMIKKIEYIKKD